MMALQPGCLGFKIRTVVARSLLLGHRCRILATAKVRSAFCRQSPLAEGWERSKSDKFQPQWKATLRLYVVRVKTFLLDIV